MSWQWSLVHKGSLGGRWWKRKRERMSSILTDHFHFWGISQIYRSCFQPLHSRDAVRICLLFTHQGIWFIYSYEEIGSTFSAISWLFYSLLQTERKFCSEDFSLPDLVCYVFIGPWLCHSVIKWLRSLVEFKLRKIQCLILVDNDHSRDFCLKTVWDPPVFWVLSNIKSFQKIISDPQAEFFFLRGCSQA